MITAALSGFRLLQSGGSFWLPPAASTAAPGTDRLFYFIFWIAAFFFLLIVGLGTAFVLRYRRRPGRERAAGPTHSTSLEVAWTVIPLILVSIIAYVGFKGFLDLATPPSNAYEVQVTAQRWKWLFTYPNGVTDENLHVPVDQPVLLVMTSEDVIHSFFVPDFRLKRDVVPGRYNKTWFRAPRPGVHTILCAEYCGTSHSDMLAQVIVHPPGEFETWLGGAMNLAGALPPAEAGGRLAAQRGCMQCHSTDGSAGIGPTFKGLFGARVALRDGATLIADEDYLRESILDPQARLVAGFDPVMPTYKGRLKDAEITSLIAHIRSLGE